MVEIDKINKGFPYLVATDLVAPLQLVKPELTPIPTTPQQSQTRLVKNICKHEQRLEQRRNVAKKRAEALLDSGATSHFNKLSDNLLLTGPSHTTVVVANGALCRTSHTAQLPMPQLRAAARITHILPAL